MPDPTTFARWLAAWVVLMGFVLWGQRKEGAGTGLVISYILQLWVIHWLAGAIYALPWYLPADSAMSLGLAQSTYAIAGFALGSAIILPMLLQKGSDSAAEPPIKIVANSTLAHTCLVVGLVAYFVLEPMLHGLPTIGAIVSATSNLLLVELGIECWNGLQSTGSKKCSCWRWVALCACMPFMTI